MKSLREHVHELLRCRLANARVNFGVRKGTDEIGRVTVDLLSVQDHDVVCALATYRIDEKLNVRRVFDRRGASCGLSITQTPDSIALEDLLRLDVEERLTNLLATLSEPGAF